MHHMPLDELWQRVKRWAKRRGLVPGKTTEPL